MEVSATIEVCTPGWCIETGTFELLSLELVILQLDWFHTGPTAFEFLFFSTS